ncbi:hypothetical protein AVEN_147153-1 [Araneus ventricosus]|uniref:Uncharacterized protein n=1 Tax=Araneus ventricosus TaxID=182803 RepID=A0A4Y2HXX3_ARAVE|nr:hypothetical protein AVEN_147153-1 [Araneus ventricosus]
MISKVPGRLENNDGSIEALSTTPIMHRGSLVTDFRLCHQKIAGSRSDSTGDPPCITAWYKLNPLRVKSLPSGGEWKFRNGLLSQVPTCSFEYGSK